MADFVRGLAALVVLAALLAGVPAGLYAVGGSPLPQHLPDWAEIGARLTQPDTGYSLFLGTVRIIGWIAWCMFLLATIAEVRAHVYGRPAVRLPGVRTIQPGTARLVATAALIFGTGASAVSAVASHPAPAAAATAAIPHDNAPADHVQAGVAGSTRAHADSQADPDEDRHYTVQPGDTLWGIAQRLLGDGRRYKQIAEENYGRHQPDGGRLTDSHWVRPGWKLRLPAAIPPVHQPPGQPPHDQSGYSGYTVKPDDTLWGIARHHLRPEATATQIEALADDIFRLNKGRPQADGEALTDPSLIKPGWKLSVPDQRETPPSPPSKPSAPSKPPGPDRPPSTRPTRPPPPKTPPAGPSVAPPTPAAPPIPAPPSASKPAPSGSSTAPAPAETPAQETHHPEHGIRLPTGGLIGGGLAAALSIALATTRAHRRRRRRPDPDRLVSPEREPVTPPAVSAARKAHLDTLAAQEEPIPSDADLVREDVMAVQPTEIHVGSRDGQQVSVPLGGMSVGLTGPGAADAARAIATELLAGAHRYRVELLIPRDDAAMLFTPSPDDLASLGEAVDGLVIPPTMAAATAHLEAEIIHRARMMERHSQEDIGSLRRAIPPNRCPPSWSSPAHLRAGPEPSRRPSGSAPGTASAASFSDNGPPGQPATWKPTGRSHAPKGRPQTLGTACSCSISASPKWRRCSA
jgi:nucleoid-associated protein YgaU